MLTSDIGGWMGVSITQSSSANIPRVAGQEYCGPATGESLTGSARRQSANTMSGVVLPQNEQQSEQQRPPSAWRRPGRTSIRSM
jgi:hypothetical protein